MTSVMLFFNEPLIIPLFRFFVNTRWLHSPEGLWSHNAVSPTHSGSTARLIGGTMEPANSETQRNIPLKKHSQNPAVLSKNLKLNAQPSYV